MLPGCSDIAHSAVSTAVVTVETTERVVVDFARRVLKPVELGDARSRYQYIYRPIQQKGTGAPTAQQVSKISFLLPQESRCSRKTAADALREGGGLYARRPVGCVPLTRQHHTARFAMVSWSISNRI
ncbi:hypothetical protein TNCV_4693031 [Trichonephila clavipes]|nr:hypothetical protein TNCV_4693031 [Trichonephila clavipes]